MSRVAASIATIITSVIACRLTQADDRFLRVVVEHLGVGRHERRIGLGDPALDFGPDDAARGDTGVGVCPLNQAVAFGAI